jgi:hypothetical protein
LSIESGSVKLILKIATEFVKISTSDIIVKFNSSLGENIGITLINKVLDIYFKVDNNKENKDAYLNL